MSGRFLQHYRRGGVKGVVMALLAKVLRRPLELAVNVPGSPHVVRIRLRSSDLWTFDEIFHRREYDVPLPSDTRTIVDVGANIGLAAVYFAGRFPGARIVALEPEERNYELLCRNVAPYPNIEPVCAALWSTNEPVELVDPGIGDWGYRVGAASPESKPVGVVAGVSVAELIRDRNLGIVDVLKVDIEGAEREVFRDVGPWIEAVRTIVIELHEDIAPGCTERFQEATVNFPHRLVHGENTVVAREKHDWPDRT